MQFNFSNLSIGWLHQLITNNFYTTYESASCYRHVTNPCYICDRWFAIAENTIASTDYFDDTSMLHWVYCSANYNIRIAISHVEIMGTGAINDYMVAALKLTIDNTDYMASLLESNKLKLSRKFATR